MSHVDCTFHANRFQLGWDGVAFFLVISGEGMALELHCLAPEDLDYLADEIDEGMYRSERERKAREFDELLYRPPEPTPNRLRFCFDGLGSLQALYQPPDRLWDMVFEDGEDGSQAVVIMSTQQVSALRETLRGKIEEVQQWE